MKTPTSIAMAVGTIGLQKWLHSEPELPQSSAEVDACSHLSGHGPDYREGPGCSMHSRSQRNQQMEISQVSAFHWCWVSKPGLGCSARHILNCFDEQRLYFALSSSKHNLYVFGSAENCCLEVRYKTGGKRTWSLLFSFWYGMRVHSLLGLTSLANLFKPTCSN